MLGRFCEKAERGMTTSHPASWAFIFRSPCTCETKPTLEMVGSLQAVVESIALAVLIAVAVIHGAHESCVATLSTIVAVLPVLAVLPASRAALLAFRILTVMSEIAFPTPLLPVVGTVRLVGCFIHSL